MTGVGTNDMREERIHLEWEPITQGESIHPECKPITYYEEREDTPRVGTNRSNEGCKGGCTSGTDRSKEGAEEMQ